MSDGMTAVAARIKLFVAKLVIDLKDMIVSILPVALPVLGISIAVFFGVKFIKKVMR